MLLRSTSDVRILGNTVDKVQIYRKENFDCDEVIANQQIDTIIHCATNYDRIKSEISAFLDANYVLPLTLFQCAINNKIKCFINTDTMLDKNVNRYALTKKHVKEWLKYFPSGLTCINVALEQFYGPGDDPSKFVTNLVRKLLANEKSINLTFGKQKRDFIFIDDVVDAFDLIIEKSIEMGEGFHDYELGTGRNLEIREFVNLVKELVGNTSSHLEFGAVPYRKNEVMVSNVDLREIQCLGWSPRISLKEGLMRTILHERNILKG